MNTEQEEEVKLVLSTATFRLFCGPASSFVSFNILKYFMPCVDSAAAAAAVSLSSYTTCGISFHSQIDNTVLRKRHDFLLGRTLI